MAAAFGGAGLPDAAEALRGADPDGGLGAGRGAFDGEGRGTLAGPTDTTLAGASRAATWSPAAVPVVAGAPVSGGADALFVAGGALLVAGGALLVGGADAVLVAAVAPIAAGGSALFATDGPALAGALGALGAAGGGLLVAGGGDAVRAASGVAFASEGVVRFAPCGAGGCGDGASSDTGHLGRPAGAGRRSSLARDGGGTVFGAGGRGGVPPGGEVLGAIGGGRFDGEGATIARRGDAVVSPEVGGAPLGLEGSRGTVGIRLRMWSVMVPPLPRWVRFARRSGSPPVWGRPSRPSSAGRRGTARRRG